MRDFSRHLNPVAAGGALTALVAFVFGVVLQPTGTPGAVVAEEQAKEEANALPVLAAGFVTAEGKLARAAGAKLSVGKDVTAPAGQLGIYRVTFAEELSSPPVVMVTVYESDHLGFVRRTTKKGFSVEFRSPENRSVSQPTAFNFIVVKVKEHTP